MNGIALTLHGTPPDDDDRYIFTEAFSELAGGSGHSAAILDTDSGRDLVNAAPIAANSNLDLGFGSSTLYGIFVSLNGIEDLISGDGDDSLIGNAADNLLRAGHGDDSLSGQSGADALYGGSATDTLRGQSGDDSLSSECRNDPLISWQGIDCVEGGNGNDYLGDGDDQDSLWGGSGRDFINGGSGSDWAAGGSGEDTFVVETLGDLLVELVGKAIMISSAPMPTISRSPRARTWSAVD